ncbi:MAG: hypothetical protein ACI8YP_001317 [Algoriphagus sp.]|jgi:hypothetical protein
MVLRETPASLLSCLLPCPSKWPRKICLILFMVRGRLAIENVMLFTLPTGLKSLLFHSQKITSDGGQFESPAGGQLKSSAGGQLHRFLQQIGMQA